MKLRLPVAVAQIAAVTWTAAFASGQISPFEFYGAERGLSSLDIETILQDADRVLWVGTHAGLFRFNGERFELFSEQQGLPSPRIRAMELFNSQLWVATEQGLAVWNGSRFAPPPGGNPLEGQTVYALAVAQGRLFAGASSGLWQMWDRTMVTLDTNPVYALHAAPGGVLWAAGPRGLWRFDPASGKGVFDGPGLPMREWRGVATSKDGILWLRANGELWSRAPRASNFTLSRSLVRSADTHGLFPMPDGNLMVPSVNGVLIWRNGAWETLDESTGLPGASSSCVYWDHEGNLWVGLATRGLARERGAGRWIMWTSQPDLPHSTVTAITRDDTGHIWVGTPVGVGRPGRRALGQPPLVLGPQNGLPVDNVSVMAGDGRGGMWIGYDYSGLVRLDLSTLRAESFGPSHGLSTGPVKALEVGPDGSVWAATEQGLFGLPQGNRHAMFQRIAAIPGAVNDIAFAANGTMWIATRDGLWRREGEEWRRFGTTAGLLENEIRFVAPARDGWIWIGYAQRGVARVRPDNGSLRHEAFSQRVAALQSDDLTFLVADPRGWAWAGHARGVDLFDGSAWRPIGFGSGLAWPDTQRQAFLLDADGSAWIGTSWGLSQYDPPDPLPSQEPPGVWLLSARFAVPPEEGAGTWNVPWEGRSLTVRFAPATFSIAENASVRYRMRGRGEDWNVTQSRTLTFPNIDAGDYTLEMAASVDGIRWTEPPLSLAFRVNPPWWRHWWVFALAIVSIVLAVRAVWAVRMRRHFALRHRLEEEIIQQQTSLEQARRTAGEMDRRFRSLLEDVRLAALIFDAENKITFCNDHLLALTGWDRDRLLGRDWIETFIPEDNRATMRARFAGADLDASGGDHYECSFLTTAGFVRILQWSNTPLRDPSGKPVAIAAIGADVTEQRKLDEQLRQIQKMESLGRLAGGVAHDFNNLLTVINGYGDLLLRKLPTANPLRRQVEEIRKAGARAFEITQQMLIFSRKQPVQPAPLSLNQVIRESVSLLERVMGEGMQLSLHLEPSLKLIRGDSGQICQILLNLASNARDAMADGGSCTIETANHDPEFVRLSVIDTGTGMSEKTQRHLFEPFFTAKEKGRGTGLGLSTVYGIVQQSGGSIRVQSAPGEGSRFDILLPSVTGAGATEPARGLVSISPVALPASVLVAEDDPVVREFVVEVLRSHGYQVSAASSGPDALETLNGAVDLLVTDLIMPGMSGRQLAAHLQERLPDLRVLYISGYADDVLGHDGAIDPDVAFLAKPFAPEALIRKVREVMAAAERKPVEPA